MPTIKVRAAIQGGKWSPLLMWVSARILVISFLVLALDILCIHCNHLTIH